MTYSQALLEGAKHGRGEPDSAAVLPVPLLDPAKSVDQVGDPDAHDPSTDRRDGHLLERACAKMRMLAGGRRIED